jgi:hypothetical protein
LTVRSGQEGRGAGRQIPQTERAGREAQAVWRLRKEAAHTQPAPSLAAEGPSRHTQARSTGRMGNSRDCKAEPGCHHGNWHGRRDAHRERPLSPLQRLEPQSQSRGWQPYRPPIARQRPMRERAARAATNGRGKRAGRARSGRRASCCQSSNAKNAGGTERSPLSLTAPLQPQLAILLSIPKCKRFEHRVKQ